MHKPVRLAVRGKYRYFSLFLLSAIIFFADKSLTTFLPVLLSSSCKATLATFPPCSATF